MNLTSVKNIKELLRKYKAIPLKQLGQSFLTDEKVLEKIIKASEIKASDLILEIGPGIGVLTKKLAERAKKVIAIEKDPKMVEILKETLKGSKNVEIINKDVLDLMTKYGKLNLEKKKLALISRLSTKNYKIVANLPYNIASRVIKIFLESNFPPKKMVFMIQKEIAKRICAAPPNMNYLAIFVQFYSKARIIDYISRGSFWPQPKVDSAIIKIIPFPKARGVHRGLWGINSRKELFFKIVKAGFSQPRKQLINNLSKKLNLEKESVKKWLLKSGINPAQRAERLNLKDWILLTKTF